MTTSCRKSIKLLHVIMKSCDSGMEEGRRDDVVSDAGTRAKVSHGSNGNRLRGCDRKDMGLQRRRVTRRAHRQVVAGRASRQVRLPDDVSSDA